MKFDVPIFVPSAANLPSTLRYLEEANSFRQYSNFGPLYRTLQNRLAQYLGVEPDDLVIVANATVALEAAIATHNVLDEWELPSWSFAASGLAALRGSTRGISFSDVCEKHGFLQPTGRKVNTLAVLPFGSSLQLLNGQLFSLIDAAASFDACRGVGAHLDEDTGIVISLHATKLLSAGEGGIFFSKNKEWVTRIKQYIAFGFLDGSRVSHTLGTNGKFSEVSAAFCLASFESWSTLRNQILDSIELIQRFCESAGIQLVGGTREGIANPYWVIKMENNRDRKLLTQELFNERIQTRLWWESGMHEMPAFASVKRNSQLENTSSWAKNYLGLPLFPEITRVQLEKVFKVLSKHYV